MLDADTYTSPESHRDRGARGRRGRQAAEHALDHGEPAFALVRPPGHHAERDKAMGFCLYNNVAVAAAAARARGLERVAIVDIDVHHGNGTQWMFYDDPAVLYVSSHQFPFYPGTGAADEVGTGPGAGFTVNVPLEAGATDADYYFAYARRRRAGAGSVRAAADARLGRLRRPRARSARVDAAECRGVFLRSSRWWPSAAKRSGSLSLVTEGGYDLEALTECLEASFLAVRADGARAAPGSAPAPRGERAVAAVRAGRRPALASVAPGPAARFDPL